MDEHEHERGAADGAGRNGRSAENGALPETPHELPIDRVRAGETADLLEAFLAVVDWRAAFGAAGGEP